MTLGDSRRVFIVVDLGFGDAGKGLVTDWLVRRTGARWVVRFNGGAQAGHNVVTADGRHHTFAQFGAGSFVAGVRTFLSRHVVVHPGALFVEARTLENKGLSDPWSRIIISAGARTITPYHQAANRLRELSRRDARHGSCGIGFGEAVHDSLVHPDDTVFAAEFSNAATLQRKLARVCERKRAEMLTLFGGVPTSGAAATEWAAYERKDVLPTFVAQARHLASLGIVMDDETLAERLREMPDPLVFEGAQGVLLDEDFGFHPHTTWSHCTSRHALDVASMLVPNAQPTTVGVLRTHAVRHGAGPLPTATDAFREHVTDHNGLNTWQGDVRYGWFDGVLSRYALEATGGVDALVLTHADVATRSPSPPLLCTAYAPRLSADAIDGSLVRTNPDGLITSLVVNTEAPSLARQERLGRLLEDSVTPVLERTTAPASIAEDIARLLGRNVDAVSTGPRAGDVHTRSHGQGTPLHCVAQR